jgi:formate-dependent nitrite reductase membrane component NrfD
MDNPESEISTLLARQQVSVRKAEKGTVPNLFYIDADEASLNPSSTERSNNYFWNSQGLGVGHYAKEAEKMAFSNPSVVDELINTRPEPSNSNGVKSIDVLMNNAKAKRIYDAPDKGILWGWEVSAYVWTKAIATGVLLIPFIGWLTGNMPFGGVSNWAAILIGMAFLGLTGLFLVKDLDRPDRFLNVLLRPQWNSWLVKGGYGISIYGGLLALLAAASWFGWFQLLEPILWLTAIAAVFVAIYTAFLFAQAKGRDFWQSPVLAMHMIIHSLMAGSAVYAIMDFITDIGDSWPGFLITMMTILILVNLSTMFLEMVTPHPTVDAKRTVESIIKGRYKRQFWVGIILIGNILPLALIIWGPLSSLSILLAGIAILIGIYITEHVWVEAPQRLPLS